MKDYKHMSISVYFDKNDIAKRPFPKIIIRKKTGV